MAEELTREQKKAVDDRGGKLLVSAAAGSGKTKVLVDRLMKYLQDPRDPADLDEFLIITYTKAAASELRGKIAAKLTEKIAENPQPRLQQQMQRLFLTKISTVHGFCADILRENAYRLGLAADFRVADENECRELRDTVLSDLLDRAYENKEKNADFLSFVDTQGVGRSDMLVPELILKVYDSAKCHLDPKGWLDTCLRSADIESCTDASETVWGKFLMDDLMDYLDCQIRVLKQCIQEAEKVEGLEKAASNIKETLKALEELRESKTWDEIVERKEIPFSRYPTIRKCGDEAVKDRIKAARDACKEELPGKLRAFADSSAQVLEDLAQAASGTRGIIGLVIQFDREFSHAKQARRILDFSDLEHKTLDLLLGKDRSAPTAAALEIGQRFREIMVDEYQDSNAVQDAIFSALTQKKQNCFMVGDVKQSIYQFRLADPGIFLEKYGSYADAEEAKARQGRKIMLSKNFRSGGEVIEAVNDIFVRCMTPRVGGLYYGENEALREGVSHTPLPDPAVELYALQAREESYAEEASFVAQRIRQMLDEKTLVRQGDGFRPVQPDDIVILLRSPGSSGSYFQRALEARGIRCASGGGNDLLLTKEIGTLRSFLEAIYNPRQDIPLLSILASPVFGFTADELAQFRAKQKYGCIYDALRADDGEKCQSFVRRLEALRREARMSTLSQLLEKCYALTCMDSIYAAMAGGEARNANLQTFFQLAADYEMGSQRDLGQFLDHLRALEGKGLISAGASSAGCVTIMSIHKSKGLEFPVVFLCGLSRKFNRDSLQARILSDKELGLGLSVADHDHRMRYPTIAKRAIAAKIEAESLSEEMRVLYVAVTRARDRLIMTYMHQNLQKKLEKIALRADFDGGELLKRDVSCPGDWVLLTALHKTEAGELFALGGKPKETVMSAFPWKIDTAEAPQDKATGGELEEVRGKMPENALDRLKNALEFSYGYTPATQAPSKQTATGRKDREKDREAAENTREDPARILRTWRRPAFLDRRTAPKTYGNAMHAAMQFIRYECCRDEQSVRAEVDRMVAQGFLSQEQGELVNCRDIAAFFDTPEGKQLRSGAEHIREFKFSILDDAANYGAALDGEQVLLQGVVDCALIGQEGIIIIDFKTDRVTENTVAGAVEEYRTQVETYGEALSRIYEMPILAKKLYFFRLKRFVDV